MEWVHSILIRSTEIALFLSLAGGYALGKVQFGKFQLGGVAGSLLVAVVISQFGVTIDNGVKTLLFALFIYAVGFESGPGFFRSLGRQSIREIVLAAVLAVTGLATVIVFARLFGLDKGLAAGVAAGALTQSAIIGTASSALAQLDLAAEEIQRLQGNVAVGYAVTYIFGSFGAIIVCVNILPWLMGRSIRDDAMKAEAALLAGAQQYGAGESPAVPDLVGRLFRIDGASGRSIADIEAAASSPVSVERVKRNGSIIGVEPDLQLQKDDIVLLVGRRGGVLEGSTSLGPEVPASEGMDVVMVNRDISLTSRDFVGRTVGDIMTKTASALKHGIYVTAIKRGGTPVAIVPDARVEAGDVVTVYGLSLIHI